MSSLPKSDLENAWIDRAAKVLPAGGFGNFAADIVIREGRAGRVWDESGNEYVDFVIGSGPMLVGHCHPAVEEAVAEQLKRGTTFFANNAAGIELAEEICAAVPCADKLRYVSSGTEADMYAMRLARAYRGREKILKFEGGYHGMSDYALMSLAPKHLANFPQPVPDTAGLTERTREDILIAPFNDIEFARQIISEYADELAGVILEPLQRLIPPAPGFLEALREETEKHGIVLIFDEVVTGFRMAWGGAQEAYGVVPDLCTLGKVIGGGFPLAAIAGRDDIMAHFDKAVVGDEGFTFQVGTLSGNPVASVAGLATLKVLSEPGTYERIEKTGKTIMGALENAFSSANIPAQVVGAPCMFDVVFTDRPVHNYRDIFAHDAGRLAQFNSEMRARGILKGDHKFYVSLAHDDADVAQTCEAIEASAKAMAAGG